MLRAQVDQRAEPTGALSSAAVIVATSRGDAASPMSRLAISIASTIATTTSSTPIARLPMRVEARLVQHLGQGHARRARTPDRASAPKSSSSTTGSSGFLVPRMNCHHVRPAAQRVRLADPRCATTATRARCEAQHAERPHRRFELVRVRQLLDAFVDREHAAEREQHQRDDERPEVARRAVAERMRLVGRPVGPAARRATAAPGCPVSASEWIDSASIEAECVIDEADELRHRDPEVGEERGDDRPPAAVRANG